MIEKIGEDIIYPEKKYIIFKIDHLKGKPDKYLISFKRSRVIRVKSEPWQKPYDCMMVRLYDVKIEGTTPNAGLLVLEDPVRGSCALYGRRGHSTGMCLAFKKTIFDKEVFDDIESARLVLELE